MTHPLYARPLVNRNPAQTNRNYVPGRDGWVAEPMDAGDGRSAHGMRQQRFEAVTRRRQAAE